MSSLVADTEGCESDEQSNNADDGSQMQLSDDDGTDGPGGTGRPKKAGTTRKPKCKAKEKVRKDQKWCKGCHKYHKCSEFPAGKAFCGPTNNALRNCRAAAVAQGERDYMNEIEKDPIKLRDLLKNYLNVTGAGTGQRAKRGGFIVAQYREETTQVSGLIFDSEHEMMNVRAFQVFKAKPEHGGLDSEESAAEWERLYNLPGATTDLKGPTAKLKRRVAVKVRDVLKVRNGLLRNEIAGIAEREKKGLAGADQRNGEAASNRFILQCN